MSPVHITSFVVLAVVWIAVPEAAFARGEDKGAAAIERGKQLVDARDYAGALQAFREAYELSPSPQASAQIGIALMGLRQWAEAEVQLEEATAATDDKWVRRNRDLLQVALERVRQKLGRLQVIGAPAGAEVRVEGDLMGTLPLPRPLRIPAGTAHVEVERNGYSRSLFDVTIKPDEITRIDVELQPLKQPLVPAAPPPAPATSAAPAAPAPQIDRGVESSPLRPAALACAITGAVTLVVGIVALVKGGDLETGGAILTGTGAGLVAAGSLTALAVSADARSSRRELSSIRGFAIQLSF